MISLEKSVSTWQFPVNKVIKFGPFWEVPYLWLVTYWQWHYRISWENGGQITKTPALIAGVPFPFPSFVFFSLPLPLPFLRLPRRLLKIIPPALPQQATIIRKTLLFTPYKSNMWMKQFMFIVCSVADKWCEAAVINYFDKQHEQHAHRRSWVTLALPSPP